MANDFFSFRQFTVRQDRCAMKVGTDGVLLGAWANGGNRVLDIGTGTGLIALMMAQRFPSCRVKAIDIEHNACVQARQNADSSPFSDRISVEEQSIQSLESAEPLFDSIVCNPPFFKDSLLGPDEQRNMARHAGTMTYRDLFDGVARLLDRDGEFSAVIPCDFQGDFNAEAIFHGMFPSRICAVKTTPRKLPKRCLLAFRKAPSMEVENRELVIGSEDYQELVKKFYIL
ncbi:MAG: methyltransferase [Prevotella sp.]|nr:methyltransferase [Prevotella sp.]